MSYVSDRRTMSLFTLLPVAGAKAQEFEIASVKPSNGNARDRLKINWKFNRQAARRKFGYN
jgi:hypothetical protein